MSTIRWSRALLATALILGALAPVAGAASSTGATGATGSTGSHIGTTGTTGTTGKTKPRKPSTAPAALTAKLYLPDVFVVHGTAVTVPGRPVTVAGYVRPYVAGQRVLVKAFLNGKLFKQDLLRIKPSSGGVGAFMERLKTPGAGTVTVKVIHDRNKATKGFTAVRNYTSLTPSAGFGSTGLFVQLIQQRLSALHFYIPLTGVYDQGTGLALDAYHRLLGWGTSQNLDGPTISYLLNGWGAFTVKFPKQGRHAEGDLTHQLLALINGSQVYWILPISSGKPSTPTILGSYQIYSRVPGYLPDGMYFSSFFTGGYAIHGYDPAPDYPASHGCMRLPIVDAIPVFNWLAMGDWVDTYYR